MASDFRVRFAAVARRGHPKPTARTLPDEAPGPRRREPTARLDERGPDRRGLGVGVVDAHRLRPGGARIGGMDDRDRGVAALLLLPRDPRFAALADGRRGPDRLGLVRGRDDHGGWPRGLDPGCPGSRPSIRRPRQSA